MSSHENLKAFFETNPLAIRAAESLKDGVQIGLTVGGTAYTFTKESKQNRLLAQAPTKADISFKIPAAVAAELASKEFDSIAGVGLFLFQDIMTNDAARKIHVKIHSGFLSLMTGGYLGVLTSGGADIAKYLATKGLSSPGKIKDAINRLRG